MCGIFALIHSDGISECDFDCDTGFVFRHQDCTCQKNAFREAFMRGRGRGPERRTYGLVDNKVLFGFHRLAINGYQDETSQQPLKMDDCVLVCNGEIYNWKELYRTLDIEPETGSDCEVIIHMYKRFGIQYTLDAIDGVFAFVLYDMESDRVIVARDPYGVRPLFLAPF